MFTVEYDESTGVVRCCSGRFLSVSDVRQYAMAVKDAAERATREYGNVAMLVISSAPQVQSAEVMETAQGVRTAYFGPHDRIAMVLPVGLAKLQAARIFASEQERIFTSEADALLWLTADRARLRA